MIKKLFLTATAPPLSFKPILELLNVNMYTSLQISTDGKDLIPNKTAAEISSPG